MKIELVEFYPKERTAVGFICGDVRIRLIDLKIEILGIYTVRRENGKWFIALPWKSGIDPDGRKVRFPIVGFVDEDHAALMAALYEQVPFFVEKRLADVANPLAWPAMAATEHQTPRPSQKTGREPTKQSVAKSQPAKLPIAKREWVDLPPRKPTQVQTRAKNYARR